MDDATIALRCRDALAELRTALASAQQAAGPALAAVHPTHVASAVNLVHYVELRRHDLRAVQHDLSSLGVSSLSHPEQSVSESIDAVIAVLDHLVDRPGPLHRVSRTGSGTLAAHADRLLGPRRDGGRTRVMVTLPSDAATRPELVRELADAGMDIARINCAHDDPPAWAAMAGAARQCDGVLVAMDLAGPKVRTGPIEPGPPAMKISPRRDVRGTVVSPAYLRLASIDDGNAASSERAVPVDDRGWLRRRAVGDVVVVADARGVDRRWHVVDVDEGGCIVAVHKTTYLAPGAHLRTAVGEHDDAAHVGDLPRRAQSIRVLAGHRVVLVNSMEPVPPSPDDADVHRIGCSLPEVFRDCQVGQRVWFDDGKFGGVVERVDRAAGELAVRLHQVPPGGAKLHAGKGINLPDTDLRLPALTAADCEALQSVVRLADIVNASFVRSADDVRQLLSALEALDAANLGVVVKIETAEGFRHLPEILLAGMRHERLGVMIARGDLAVEVGFERLAEVQEEMLWLCEAARVPVIWATEVLDSMARTGRPSRAEVTDAARAHRAECVMLNKGPHITDAVRAVQEIVQRMHQHQGKKHHLLRRLRAWDDFAPG